MSNPMRPDLARRVHTVLVHVPGDQWATEHTITADLRAAGGLEPGVSVTSMLSEARRQGLVIRDRRGEVTRYSRTPKGGLAAAAYREAAGK